MARGAAWAVAIAITLGADAGAAVAQPLDYYAPPYPGPAYASPPPAYSYPPPAFYPPPGVYDRRGYDAPPVAYGYGPPAVTGYGSPETIIELPPPRPRSCGRYRYWNGEYCADARYERPYLGPK